MLAGEPGGSIPARAQRIEEAWQATVLDHGGATEVGPWGYADVDAPRAARDGERIHRRVSLASKPAQPAAEGELAELVLTNLGRVGCPVIRYRTGDLVRPIWQHDCETVLCCSKAACWAAPTTC